LRSLKVNLLCCLVNSGFAALLVAFDLLHDVARLVLLLAAGKDLGLEGTFTVDY